MQPLNITTVSSLKGLNAVDVATSKSSESSSYTLQPHESLSFTPFDIVINFGQSISSLSVNQVLHCGELLFAVTSSLSDHHYSSSCSHEPFLSLRVYSINTDTFIPSLYCSYTLPHGCPRLVSWYNGKLVVVLGNGDLIVLSVPIKPQSETDYNQHVIHHVTNESPATGFRSLYTSDYIITGTDDGRVILMNLPVDDVTVDVARRSGDVVKPISTLHCIVLNVAESPVTSLTRHDDVADHVVICAGSYDGSIHLINCSEPYRTKTKLGQDPITSLCWPNNSIAPIASSSLGFTNVIEGRKRFVIKNGGGLSCMCSADAMLMWQYGDVMNDQMGVNDQLISVFGGGVDGFLRFLATRRVKSKGSSNFNGIFTAVGRSLEKSDQYLTVCFDRLRPTGFSVPSVKNSRVGHLLKVKNGQDQNNIDPLMWTSVDSVVLQDACLVVGVAGQMGRIFVCK
ncbi:hypothetical protein P9112_006059 [Eukaryota sp. TZLM1-RC]